MKKLNYFILLVATAVSLEAKDLKIAIVDLKVCAELSKMGKKEQEGFEALRKQMESVLGEKEKVLTDLNTKLNDADYLDSLTLEAETELKRKFRTLSQEAAQLQQQYMQMLQQANFKVVQSLTDSVTAASQTFAKKEGYDLLLNKEVAFYSADNLDVSKQVVSIMDVDYDAKLKEESAQSLKGSAPIAPK
jgi:outer membrane protein